MNIKDAQYIIAIVEEGSIAKASEKSFLTSSALSRVVFRVEKGLGKSLFDKTKVPWELTNAGELFFETAQKIVRLNNRLVNGIQKIGFMEKESLDLAVMFFEEKHLLPMILPRFRARYPDFKVNLVHSTEHQVELLVSDGNADVGIVVLPTKRQDIEAIPIKDYNVLLAISLEHPLAKDYPYPTKANLFPEMDLSLLKDEPFIILKPTSEINNIAFNLCKSFGFTPKVSLEANKLDTAFSFVSVAYGGTFIFDQMINEQNRFLNAYFRIKDCKAIQTIALAYKKGEKLGEETRFLLELLQAK